MTYPFLVLELNEILLSRPVVVRERASAIMTDGRCMSPPPLALAISRCGILRIPPVHFPDPSPANRGLSTKSYA
jgi:hypothetical protein